MKRRGWLSLGAVVLVSSMVLVRAESEKADPAALRQRAARLKKDGNWKDAYEVFARLATDPEADRLKVGEDLNEGLYCLQRLGRLSEVDGFREKVIAAHGKNWRLLHAAAQSYLSVDHHGAMVAGEFVRGPHRGGTAKFVNSYERDRVRALQLMDQAAAHTAGETNKPAVADFFISLANMCLANRGYSEAWRLQYLTDLTTLPDYEDGYYYGGRYYGGTHRGAPVDEKGEPVYHSKPANWKAARTDGERWRWALAEVAAWDPGRVAVVQYIFASFLHHQFGVQTMREYRWYFGRQSPEDDTRKDTSGTYAMHTLGEDETIAKLATGIKRFRLPNEFNYLRIFKDVADGQFHASDALDTLAGIFENRRQYPRAAGVWKQTIERFGAGPQAWRQKRLDQIVSNWGLFEPIMTQPADKGATVEFRFRNGQRVDFTAHEIDVKRLLDDVKAYLKSKPAQLDWEKTNVENIGWRLVEKNQQQYLGEQVAAWRLDLKPRPNHFDTRITVNTPLQKAGAYLLTAKMAGGNVSRIILWVADTALVKKQLDNQVLYYVADARTGEPVAKANLEFFGYRQEYVSPPGGRGRGTYVIHIRDYAEFSDQDGQVFQKAEKQEGRYNWLITATTPGGRLAYLGFTGVWYNAYYDHEYNATKVFVITDRPVYRPEQPVKFKFWVNHAKYDLEGKSAFAGKQFLVRVNDPKGEKIFEKTLTADEYGGFDGELTLAKGAALGQYYIYLPGEHERVRPPRPVPMPRRAGGGMEAVKAAEDPKVLVVNPATGGGHFRVEEYKKPEFEVAVEAPKEPVMLGEKVEAKIVSKYYFGAPVTEAKVKYKVLRTSHSARWYPICPWDWFYGRGYWWYAYDYLWYPGWKEWGCPRPTPWWWWRWGRAEQPEVVAEAEVPVGADGTVTVTIDTGVAKAIHPDTDHRYSITAEVTDQSRRTIVGTGEVLVARKPFKVYAWVHRGHYRTGDVVEANFKAHTLDNKPVAKAAGELRLLKITYKDAKPVETEVQKWKLDTDAEGRARQQMKADQPGQYRLSYKVTDSKQHAIEGGYVFVVRGAGFDGGDFRFNDLELVTDKQEYKPGEKVQLMVNTDRAGAAVLLFVRAANGVCLPPRVLRLKGKSAVEAIEVVKKDMPNFFVEALTVHSGKVFTEMREVVVPPESRVINVKVEPSAEKYKPGEKATVKVKLTDPTGEPFTGSVVLSMYDKAVEYISGGSNVGDIKEFFWKWRRHHRPRTESSLHRGSGNILRSKEIAMSFLGVFGYLVIEEVPEGEEEAQLEQAAQTGGLGGGRGGRRELANANGLAAPGEPGAPMAKAAAAPGEALRARKAGAEDKAYDRAGAEGGPGAGQPMVQPTVRTKFADTAVWTGALEAKDGSATVSLTMPENLTTWKTRVWAMGAGTRCGEGTVDVVTTKNLILRLQAPRFFVQKDEVVLSANVHNYLKEEKHARVILEIDEIGGAHVSAFGDDGTTLMAIERLAPAARPSRLPGFELPKQIQLEAGGERRVDWRIRVDRPGEIAIRMKALTDEESDAMEMKFPVYIHGMLKTESFCGVIRPEKTRASVNVTVPAERLGDQSRLEVRYSPTLAGAMVDALPYMVDYPYGCTEQTLNRFLPTVITQKVLLRMGVDLKDIEKKITNLNAQEIGDDVKRMHDWQRLIGKKRWDGEKWVERNPVFDEEKVADMVKAGLEALTSMQCSDGGWGWFSGWGERSWPHTTAVVVHGLQIARANDVAIVPGVLERGVKWLQVYQAEQVRRLKLPKDHRLHKSSADNLDGLVYMVLVDEKSDHDEMRKFLYRDRNNLAVYTKAMFALALHRMGHKAERDMLRQNVEQFLKQDDENQTAWLDLTAQGNWWWWCWHGSEYEAQAYYLKLLAAVEPKSEVASRMVKYLLNNRRHATYWKSTRDTSVVIEAFADYIKASGEDKPDMTIQVLLDGKAVKEVKVDSTNLFSFDNKFVLTGAAVTTGRHTVELVKKGTGPVYFNAYLTNFTLEDPIKRAGLEIKVLRDYYRLVPVDKKVKDAGSRGQVVDKKVEKYERQALKDLDMLTSGDLVEIELVIESKNDYEYILFEDMKPAGLEPVEVRSGYGGNEMGAYMELRDERVTFFVRALARGKHSVSYRMRAEIPGRFSALPTKASAMYAPELKANSDEMKLRVKD